MKWLFGKIYGNRILRNVFFQLLLVYLFFILFLYLRILDKYALRFGFFALVVACFSFFVRFEEREMMKRFSSLWLFVPVLILIVVRILPFISGGSFFLGYDCGLYKSLFEQNSFSLLEGKMMETEWGREMYPPGISFVVHPFFLMGLDSEFLVSFGLIFFDVLILIGLFVSVSEFFSRRTAFVSAFFYSASVIAFYSFYLCYYKNIVGIFLILMCCYLFRKGKFFWGSLVGGFLGGLHRPSFFLFGLGFFFYWLFNRRREIFYSGLFMLVLVLGFYFDRFYEMIFSLISFMGENLVGELGSGTFMSLKEAIFVSLPFIPFFFVGFIKRFRERKFDFFLFLTIFSLVIVVFNLFFYRRMIIFLSVFFLIYAAYGLVLVFDSFSFWWRWVVVLFLVVSCLVFVFDYAWGSSSLITEGEMEGILWISENVPSDSLIFSVHRFYSPWLEGWSGHKVVAPGLFDYDIWNKSDWISFWAGNFSRISEYEGEKYIFLGRINEYGVLDIVSDLCFDVVYEKRAVRILKYVC